MATVSETVTTVTRKIKVPVYTLTLSQDEAQALIEVLAHVGTVTDGSFRPNRSRGQQLVTDVFDALCNITGETFTYGVLSGGIEFYHEDDDRNVAPDLFTKDLE